MLEHAMFMYIYTFIYNYIHINICICFVNYLLFSFCERKKSIAQFNDHFILIVITVKKTK